MPEPRPPLKVIEGGRRPRRPVAPALELGALGLGLTLTIIWMAGLDGWREHLGTFQALYAVAFAFFALPLLRRRRYANVPAAPWMVVGVAVAARLALLPVTPSLSDDVHRYVWEGIVVVEGNNPYTQAPADSALVHLRDDTIYPGVNHKELSTIYPPLGEAGFALVAAVSPTVLAMKTWVVLHDIALVLVLLIMLRRRRLGVIPLIAYAWNPLVLVEFAGSGHNDPTAMLWLAVAMHLASTRPVGSALALSVGVLVKLGPLLALPFLIRAWSTRARLVCLACLSTGLGAFWLLTRGDSSGLRAYASRWRNNELAFHYLDTWLGSFDAARWAVGGIIVGVMALALWKGWETLQASRLVIRVATMASAVVHPWYLGWTLMFEPFGPSAPWLLLSLTATLNYGLFRIPAEGASYHLPLAWRWVEYGLPLLLAVILTLHRRNRNAPRLPS